ncbi:TolC family protein [Parabacteroides sp. Marseille-P3160]|uniref:TolC family protein n=1 Tax=Parabacteroides sp. Marseille-P3160 TaxID=1917887 RepID=UPI0009BA1664|nr:TolC family protein [Parabacteroides sp. Marseille-P3160]
MRNKLLLACLLLTGASQLPGQTVKTLDLGECINLAIDSSLQAFRAKNLYQSSYWEYRSYKAGRLPSLTLNMTPIQYYRDFTRRYDSENNMDVYRRQQSLYSYGNLAIKQNFDLTGGTFFIDTELGYMRNFGDNTYTQYNTVPIRVGYSQSLFGFNSFKWEKKIEPLKYEKAKKQFIYSREEISESVIQYFFALAMAQAEYDMARENVASSDTLYRIGQERHKIAAISQGDLLTLKLDAVNAQNTLKNTDIELKRAMFSLVSFLNMDKETQIRLKLPDRPRDLTLEAGTALDYARENNPDFLANKQEILEAEQEVDRTKKSSNFDASFSVSVGFNQAADQLSNAYKNPLQQDVVSIGLTIPLVDWGVRKGKANMAKNNLNVTKISVQQKELTLEQEVVMTVNDFNIQQDLIASAEEAMELANKAYEITKQRFIIGKADISSLTLSLNRQKEAQKNYISSLKNYWLSYFQIRKLTLFDFEQRLPLSSLFDRQINIIE